MLGGKVDPHGLESVGRRPTCRRGQTDSALAAGLSAAKCDGGSRRRRPGPRPAGISFPDKYDKVPPVYAELIRHLVQGEEVNINVWDLEMEATVRSLLARHKTPLERVHFHPFPAYEPWCRDHGPIFLVRDH